MGLAAALYRVNERPAADFRRPREADFQQTKEQGGYSGCLSHDLRLHKPRVNNGCDDSARLLGLRELLGEGTHSE